MNNKTKGKRYVGLTQAEVEASRRQHGENLLTPPKRTPIWKLYLEKYNDPIIKILLVAALVSFGLAFINGEFIETLGIFLAIFIATTVGFVSIFLAATLVVAFSLCYTDYVYL